MNLFGFSKNIAYRVNTTENSDKFYRECISCEIEFSIVLLRILHLDQLDQI